MALLTNDAKINFAYDPFALFLGVLLISECNISLAWLVGVNVLQIRHRFSLIFYSLNYLFNMKRKEHIHSLSVISTEGWKLFAAKKESPFR